MLIPIPGINQIRDSQKVSTKCNLALTVSARVVQIDVIAQINLDPFMTPNFDSGCDLLIERTSSTCLLIWEKMLAKLSNQQE